MIRNKLILSLKVFLIYFIISLKIYAADSNSQNKLVVLGVDGAPIKIKIIHANGIENFLCNSTRYLLIEFEYDLQDCLQLYSYRKSK